jgi:ssRNA-specific RNase YbeY (16S rRNA maturation enzyme)
VSPYGFPTGALHYMLQSILHLVDYDDDDDDEQQHR